MDTIYTTTITKAAQRRGIHVKVCDPVLPVFTLCLNDKEIRCYNSLTDKVGAASFHLAQDKGAANRFLKDNEFSVPDQQLFTDFKQAEQFLHKHSSIVVKPVSQWGGRGVSTCISNSKDLRKAVTVARNYCDEIVLEQYVKGIDWRLIFVDSKFICAIQRDAATITGDGNNTIRQLIKMANKEKQKVDPSNKIPLDIETLRCLQGSGLSYESIPANDESLTVRRTTNYHTGGTVAIVTDKVNDSFVRIGEEISRLYNIPVMGIDMLVNPNDETYYVIELSPDLAISPPEGEMVAEAFLDYLFPESKSVLIHNSEKSRIEPECITV